MPLSLESLHAHPLTHSHPHPHPRHLPSPFTLVKGDSRIRSKALSREDHAEEPRPRPALNIDVNRNCLTFDTPEELLAAAQALCSHPRLGAVRIKNGFAMSGAEAKKAFHYRTLMLNMLFDTGVTFGELAADPRVRDVWDTYVEAPPSNPAQPWDTWRNQARAAVAHLRSPAMAGRPVKLIVESQLLLREYKIGRDEMHLLYKVVRSDTDKALFKQFAGSRKKSTGDVGGHTWISEEARAYDEAEAELERILHRSGDSSSESKVEEVGVLLRSACVEGFRTAVDVLLRAEIVASALPASLGATGRVERVDEVKGEPRMAILSHTMQLPSPLLLGLPNAGICFVCRKMRIARNCKRCHLCSNCASGEYCVPCTDPCRWCKPQIDEGVYKYHEHECCAPSKIQLCESKRLVVAEMAKREQEEAEEKSEKEIEEGETGGGKGGSALARLGGGGDGGSTSASPGGSGGILSRISLRISSGVLSSKKKKKPVETSQSREDRSKTALYLACEEGHESVTEALLGALRGTGTGDGLVSEDDTDTSSAVLNQATEDGWTPLLVAAFNGHESIVRQLVAAPGIDVNAVCSPLLATNGDGEEKKKEKKEKKGRSSPNAEYRGMPPLILASHLGHEGVVRILLSHEGVDANQPTATTAGRPGTTALAAASAQGHLGVVALLLALDGVELAPRPGCVHAIWTACNGGHVKLLKLFLSQRPVAAVALLNTPKPTNSMTPLVAACMYGSEDVATCLLDLGKDVVDVHAQCTDADDGKKLTALLAASKIGNVCIVEKILAGRDAECIGRLLAAEDFKKRNALKALIYASRKKTLRMKATAITSRGHVDRPRVEVLLKAAAAGTVDAEAMLASAAEEKAAADVADREDEAAEAEREQAEAEALDVVLEEENAWKEAEMEAMGGGEAGAGGGE